MTSGPSRPAPPAPEAVAQALALLLTAMEDSEPAGDGNGQDIESKITHLDRLAWRREVAVEALQFTGQTEAALFRRRRNALLPIHRLPSELLSAILINSIRENQPDRTKALQSLARVAWQWWQTIKSDPQFWTHITPPNENAELQIRKAGILPLRLNLANQRVGDEGHSSTTCSKVDKHGPPRLPRECCAASVIESEVWRFNVAEFQSLREAHLPIVPYFSVSSTSNNPLLLQTLHLNLNFDGSHSSYDLESVLRYNPQLIELEVEDLNDDTSPPSPVNTPIINLPMLRHLRFSNVVCGERGDKIPLLAQIRAPLLETLGLCYHAQRGARAIDIGARTIFNALVTRPRASLNRSEDAPLYSTLRNAGPSASWTILAREVSITAKGSGKGRLDIQCPRKDYIPRYILRPLAKFTLPVDLDLGRCDEDTKLAFWDGVLDATPLLRSFTLACPVEVAQQVLDRLSTKAPSPSSTNPRAPLLEKVRFQHDLSSEDEWSADDAEDAVRKMLEGRRNLFIQGGVLDPPRLVVTGPYGAVFDEAEGKWVASYYAKSW
ncbi:hypothetical protein FRC04_008250 [Tulasnella sp. 424]|nr:hypothetical protein FRC04_008250 [Tulasnella sp. 424]KAG8958987.1 hypothetical protein FRC05_008255 [Tulasnella sp. 425]